ncbi:MAG: hypothetical protein PF518_04795 [Spirochaetaceae bacterium]|jgi:hypothetical protein|nr:hypothetical protein [Spirochaetaceae bacterium]
MQIDKGALLKAVKKVMPGVGTGAKVLEGSDNIIFSEIGLHSFNRAISVTVPFEYPEGEFLHGTVNAIDLFNILNNKRLKVISDTLEVKQISIGIKFSGNQWDSVLDFQEDSEWMSEKITTLSSTKCEKELPTDFKKGMYLCSIKGNNIPQHGVYVKGTGMYSTDKRVGNIYEMDSECEEFWIGQDEVNEFVKVPGIFTHYELSSSMMGHWVHFKDNEGTIFSMTLKDCSLYQKALTFLLTQQDIVPVDTKLQGTLPSGFADAIETCSLMADKEKSSGKKNVEITFTSEKMVVKGIKIGGKLTNSLPWDEDKKMDLGNGKLKYRFVSNNIIAASRKAKDFFINKMEGAGNACMIVMYDEDFKTILLSLKQ